jgi:hypothetical protein
MRPNPLAALLLVFLAACAGAKPGGSGLVVVESHQFT